MATLTRSITKLALFENTKQIVLALTANYVRFRITLRQVPLLNISSYQRFARMVGYAERFESI